MCSSGAHARTVRQTSTDACPEHMSPSEKVDSCWLARMRQMIHQAGQPPHSEWQTTIVMASAWCSHHLQVAPDHQSLDRRQCGTPSRVAGTMCESHLYSHFDC